MVTRANSARRASAPHPRARLPLTAASPSGTTTDGSYLIPASAIIIAGNPLSHVAAKGSSPYGLLERQLRRPRMTALTGRGRPDLCCSRRVKPRSLFFCGLRRSEALLRDWSAIGSGVKLGPAACSAIHRIKSRSPPALDRRCAVGEGLIRRYSFGEE
jgi:hypothetical protein